MEAFVPIDAAVYFVLSPDAGPSHRIFDDEDISAHGSMGEIERHLEKDSYWYGRLGMVQGHENGSRTTFSNHEFKRLPRIAEVPWRIGLRNPAFNGTEIERRIFKAAFLGIQRMLDTWKSPEGDEINAYTLKTLHVTQPTLARIAAALQNVSPIHASLEISVMKYWYCKSWEEEEPMPDLILGEFPLSIPLRFQWCLDAGVIKAEALRFALC